MRLFLSALLISLSMLAHAQSTTARRRCAGPVLTFEKTTHDFGKVPEGPSASWSFRFRNTGGSPLIILRCQTSDPHVASWPKAPILPGKKDSIIVTMPTHGRRGPFGSKLVYIQTNAQSSNAPRGYDSSWVHLEIRGLVVPDTGLRHL